MNVHTSARADAAGASAFDATEAASFLELHRDVQYVDCVFADICGNIRGKRIARNELEAVYRKGLTIPPTIYFLDSRGEAAASAGGAGTAWPVPGSLSTVSWSQRPHGQALMTLRDAMGDPYFGEPRNVLARVVERFKAVDLVPAIGATLEFHLVERSKAPPQIPPDFGDGQCKALFAALAQAAGAQRIPAFEARFAAGHVALSMGMDSNAIRTADSLIFLRQVVRAVARQYDMDATFMAKPFPGAVGSAMQVAVGLHHASGETLFDVARAEGTAVIKAAVAGMQALTSESIALFAPSVNGYRRFASETATPRNKRWGFANRTANLSLPGTPDEPQLIWNRFAGADANPYLVIAAILAGVHYGITQQLDAGAPVDGDASNFVDETLPFNIDGALLALENGSVMREYLGPAYVDLYCTTKRTELERFRAFIPPHEYDWYL